MTSSPESIGQGERGNQSYVQKQGELAYNFFYTDIHLSALLVLLSLTLETLNNIWKMSVEGKHVTEYGVSIWFWYNVPNEKKLIIL